MIFHHALRREISQAALGVFVALFAILLSTLLIRLLGEAAAGKAAPEAVAALLGFASLNYVAALLSLAAFIAVLLALSRAYRDSEMVVWFASGLSLTAWIRPVLAFILPLTITIGALSFFVSPWALQKSAEYQNQVSARRDTGAVSPGAFQEAVNGQHVVFVEAIDENAKEVQNVFVSSMNAGKLGVIMAKTGYQEIAANGDRFIVLEKGRRYELTPGQLDARILEYERYALRIEEKEARGIDVSPKSMSTFELIEAFEKKHQAELLWRIGLPISSIVLVLIAIPLSFVNPRAGRSANMLLAIFIFFIYNNLMTVSQAWVANGKLSFLVGVFAVHLLMLAILPMLFVRRIFVFSLARVLK